MLFWAGIAGVASGLVVLVVRRLTGNYVIDGLTTDVPDIQNPAFHAAFEESFGEVREEGDTRLPVQFSVGSQAHKLTGCDDLQFDRHANLQWNRGYLLLGETTCDLNSVIACCIEVIEALSAAPSL